jgi:hypothetical protein
MFTRQRTVCRIPGSTSGIRLLSGVSVGCIGSNPLSIHRDVPRGRAAAKTQSISRKGAKAAKKSYCHFDRREKSFLDPSHSLGLTGLARQPKEDFPKLRGFRPDHQINVALQELKQRHELIE